MYKRLKIILTVIFGDTIFTYHGIVVDDELTAYEELPETTLEMVFEFCEEFHVIHPLYLFVPNIGERKLNLPFDKLLFGITFAYRLFAHIVF